jgi:hypothetical protein
MVRRSLFFGLTLLLVAAIAFLAMRGRRQEKEQDTEIVEKVEKAQLSPTRVFFPQDILIALLKTDWQKKENQTGPSYTAIHAIEVCNRGNLPLKEIQLRFVYRWGSTKQETRAHSVVKSIPAGATVTILDVSVDGLPQIAANARASVVYADIGAALPPE